MSKQSRKASLREHEWADEWGGEKISRMGYEGPDVMTPPLVLTEPMTQWEVKSTEDLPLWLTREAETRDKRGWIPQMEKDGSHGIAFRQNRKPWYVIIRADRLIRAEAIRAPGRNPEAITIDGFTYRLERA